jgi:hypothetical protein
VKSGGVIFAIAGYSLHDVHKDVLFTLLSLETIDSERIAALVGYFTDYAEYVVVALLLEDAQVLDDSYPRVERV